MKFSVAALVVAGAATVSAQEEVYQIRSNLPIAFYPFLSANEGTIRLGELPPHASCEGPAPPFATFYTQGGALFLYTPEGKPQQVYADMTPEGKGKLRYTQPSEPLGDDMAAGGWDLSVGRGLTWNGAPLAACPIKSEFGSPYDIFVREPEDSNGDCTPLVSNGEPQFVPLSRCTYP
ncbi:hypothetical protein ESCO_002314 [Escovopsis weberi]|uniref:Cell wall protein PhiA n=1 Tax=Escovopsis weberi TaxID=150374 RepID=A0A0M8N8Z4_ESCWE|nr:hypothetical protein ESCO_002314 [Escovopsis weberi]